MNTSYFTKYRGDRGVAITYWVPPTSPHRRYPPLAPTRELVQGYKEGLISEEEYTKLYLGMLEHRGITPEQVLKDLGPDAVLLCFESKGKFCHRHLASEWLRKGSVECTEL